MEALLNAAKNLAASEFGIGTTVEEDELAEAKAQRNSQWAEFVSTEAAVMEAAAANADCMDDEEEWEEDYYV